MSLITYRNIVTKTYFPREIVPLAQVCSRLVDLAASATLYALLMLYYGAPVGPWVALVPLFVVMLIAFTIGVTLTTSALNVFYRDVNPVVQISLQLWLYLTPVAYPLSGAGEHRVLSSSLTAVGEDCARVDFGRAPDGRSTHFGTMIIALLVDRSRVQAHDKYFADVI